MTRIQRSLIVLRIAAPIIIGAFGYITGHVLVSELVAYVLFALGFLGWLFVYWRLTDERKETHWRYQLFNLSLLIMRASGFELKTPEAANNCAEEYYKLSKFLYDNGLRYSRRESPDSGPFYYKIAYSKTGHEDRFYECVSIDADGFHLKHLHKRNGDYIYEYTTRPTSNLSVVERWLQQRLFEFKSHCDAQDLIWDKKEAERKAKEAARAKELADQQQKANQNRNNGGNWPNNNQGNRGKGNHNNRSTQTMPQVQQQQP